MFSLQHSNNCFHHFKSFEKLRIGSSEKDRNFQNLLSQKIEIQKEIKIVRNARITLNVEELVEKLSLLEDDISSYAANKNTKRITKHIEEISNSGGRLDITKMWKMRKKLCPKSIEVPSAKFNEKGILVTKKCELKTLYKNTYIDRLSHCDILPEYETIFVLKNYLFDLRMKVTGKVKSPDWTINQLVKVLKSLKNNKSADHFGMVYELFKPGLIGKDLLKSLLILCNEIKNQQKIPKFLKYTDITSFYKSKGDRRSLENDRGVFSAMKVRSVIDRLAYNDYYQIVDQKMSDSNV